ncbi:hypothetical protein DVA86_19210 [Streptomyces armeniacus]|uniref:Tetratricopeptide repeat protein n=1 Tax=Streptomyces armeniacus TaxID=83291 RepID=A0A345Y0Q6_9ACTN|nr:hypothetical protein [Streptomyces armeniacus]AXK37472.1 hypothetical protein DVA86_19210 [Streptomyces armeniacus]
MTRIGQAIILHRGGDREEARNRFARLWEEAGEDEAALFHRCTIAHYMADTQDHPADELEWDRRALAAADALSGERVAWGRHELAVRALYPSLHLNLAADHVKLHDTRAARRELLLARGTAAELAHDDYGQGIRAAIDRLELRLAGMDQRP